MSIYASKQQKSQDLMETILILAYVMIISILIVSSFNTNVKYDTLRQALGSRSHVYVGSPSGAEVSFASDEIYWTAHCSRGWVSDSVCDSIVIRATSCESGSTSAYCSNYQDHLKRRTNK